MKLFHRYVLKQYLANLALGLLVFTFVLMLDHLFELVDLLINKGVGVVLTLKLLFYLLPSSLVLTLPISNLLAALLTYGHLSETNEITAARASGLSAWHFLIPPLSIAGLCTAFLFPFNTRWAPQAQSHFRSLYVQVLESNPLIRIEPKMFVDVGDYHLYVEKRTRKAPPLHGITIYKIPAQGAPLRIFADTGFALVDPSKGIKLDLQNGHIEQIDAENPDRWFYTTFKTYELLIPFESEKQGSVQELQEMDSAELRHHIDELRQKRLPYPIFACEMNLRWALAVAPLLFVLVGIPLAIRVRKGGRSIGFGLSLVILLIYYVVVMMGLSFGQRGQWPVVLAIWLANMILGAVGIALSWRLLRQ